MIFHIQAYLPILVATAANLTIGALWYSENLFGPMWRNISGKQIDQSDMGKKFALQAIASLITAAALFIAISIFEKTQSGVYAKEGFFKIFSVFLQDIPQNNSLMSAMKTAGFLWLGFMAPSKAGRTIWGSGNWRKFAIEATEQLVSLIAMAAIISSLS